MLVPKIRLVFCLLLLISVYAKAQPANDDCANASVVDIANGGFGLGLFTSTQYDLTSATLQTGETFSPSINTAGLNKKSVWYKFSIPTTRSIRVSLAQPGSAIQAGNVGFTVYKASTCLPGDAQISTKLSPIETFGSTFHPCVADGEYYVQVSSSNGANGPIFVTVQVDEGSPALYDKPATAYQFGSLTANQQIFKDIDIDCHSIDDANEVCLSATSFKDYTKSIWYTFTTPAYFDYLNTWFASVTTPYNSPSIKIGYRLYQGDGTTTPLSGLTQIGGCDSLMTDLYAIDRKQYRCGDLLPNTTYTVQLVFHKDFKHTVRFGAEWNGRKLTNGPLPVSSLATPNKMGTLAANSSSGGALNTISDVFGCNSRHSENSCPKSMPASGVLFNNNRYKLSSFISFNLANTSSVYFNTPVAPCSASMLLRLFKQDLTANCTDLDTANLIATFPYSTYQANPVSCLSPGNYVLQVMAEDSIKPKGGLHYSSLSTNTFNYLCTNLGLGSAFTLNLYVRTEVASNKFDLSAPGRFEKINANGTGVMQPLQRNVTYTAVKDTFGCANTVLPSDTLCNPHNIYGYLGKASYREFALADSSMLYFENVSSYSSKLYQGDADALTTVQNKHNFPDRFTGLIPYSKCMDRYYSSNQYACAVPGTYTHASFDNRLSFASTVTVTPRSGKSKYGSPETAQDMGDLWSYIPVNTWHHSGLDTFRCFDNAVTIDGVVPCSTSGRPATKLIYRQFYLSKPTLLQIRYYVGYSGEPVGSGLFTLFKGKATDGIDSLKKYSNAWTCFSVAGSNGQCDAVPAGWYTVVSYGYGPSYANPTGGMDSNTNYHSSILGYNNKFSVYLGQACDPPKFNRPHKASIDTLTGQPYKIEWKPQTGHTSAYPLLGKTYTLNRENFDCTQDTTFIRQQMNGCNSTDAKVAFYVFTTTQEAYLRINVPASYWSKVYSFDVRTNDSLKLKNGIDTALHACTDKSNTVEFCRLQPGTYTLVIFASAAYTCNNINPTIYIDSVAYSRFDHAAKAYDFGDIKPDSTWYKGKIGDVNPLHPGRAPSNDFMYCTTGAQVNDPDNGKGCYTVYNPYVYPSRPNQVMHPLYSQTTSYQDRRTLWHTFTVRQPGTIRVRVNGMKGNQNIIQNFAVYSSDEDGSLPFSTLQANGLVDSTLLQGLVFKGLSNTYCPYRGNNMVSFFVDPCSFKPTRYYVITDNFYSDDANFQVEVEVLLDSVTAKPPKFDHFSQANDMGLVNSGIKKGETDNYTCATKDLTDPLAYQFVSNCNKTLWYKFTTTATGQIRYAAFFNGANQYYYNHIQLFRQIKQNDSSATGLQHMPYITTHNNNGTWAQQCISPGTYYIILPGCNAVNEDVYPQIEIIPQAGDFCSDPMVTGLTGPGTRVVPVTIDCHTIGTDYGEFNPTLTCPANATTSNYKTSWYRLDITGTDTLDVTVFINENTNATSTDIKYRMMTGSCGAMQEQSCVQDALTRNTYKCLAPGNSYYIQVFTPNFINGSTKVVGTIDLNLNAVVHADSCFPANNCIGVANFTPKFDCTKDKAALFTNYSTFGSAITYQWDFGHNNQTSDAVSPGYFYPALTTAATYTVKLVITNTTAGCNKKDSSIQTITIPARPAVDLGPDTLNCTNGRTVLLNATSHPGSTYYWNNGSTQPTLTAGGISSPWVEVTYNGCKTRDTINVWINPIAKKQLQTQALCNVTTVTLTASRGQGEQYRWNNGGTTGSITVAQPGYYWADLYLNGCTIRDSFLVVNADLKPLGNDTTLCQRNMPFVANAMVNGASSYKWQNNTTASTFNITQPGLYWVDIVLGGCTFRDTIVVKVDSFKINTSSANICQGQTYTLPSGRVVSVAGTYADTIRNLRGCDSLISNVSLAIKAVLNTNTGASICAGQTYTLPSGAIVNNSGTYRDTIRFITGCDSLITTTNLSVNPLFTSTNNATICSGQAYTLPSGKTVFATGTYGDTVRYLAGCDSLITTTNVVVKTVVNNSISPSICQGQNYTLPSGFIVTSAGTYADTMRYVSGCDSVISTVVLAVNSVANISTNANICSGQNYTLPSGKSVNATGFYIDTLKYVSGCDSLITTTNLSVKPLFTSTKNATICSGQAYTLPSGKPVFGTGTYRDTVRYLAGCDSLITTTNVVVKTVINNSISASICQGQSYSLPSGFIVTSAGTYTDTVRYAGGCDSLISTVVLAVNSVANISTNASICSEQNYTLPSGKIVNTAGSYIDTLKYVSGCDSLISNINLSVKNVTRSNGSATICHGQIYTFPSGKIISTNGIFNDTLKYQVGCDSIITTIDLTVKAVTTIALAPKICEGQTYTLPSGKVVNASAVYSDTLKYRGGCDSVINIVNLLVQNVTRSSIGTTICSGQNYILPSGKTVNAAGIYQDTVKNTGGCDSLISSVAISLKQVSLVNVSPSICAGQFFALPSGKTINKSGIYNDTLRYTSGCDSLIITAALVVKEVVAVSTNSTVCQGQWFTLPSGKVISNSGVYKDTVRYITGCDSLITTVALQVTQPVTRRLDPSICIGGSYTLPSGTFISTAGTYTDVIKSAAGCDSVVTTVRLSVNPYPNVTLSKSNDINCMLGAATLTATGGLKYEWLPQTGLTNPNVFNPIASPAKTTTYKAQVTSAGGCTTTDSIQLIVNLGDASGGYVLPSAFTPNGDGKNDCFGVKTWGWVKDLQFIVFDRWGNIVHKTTDPSQCWDGSFKGEKMGSGAYVYHISATTICGPVQRKGTIILIR